MRSQKNGPWNELILYHGGSPRVENDRFSHVVEVLQLVR
jgi:hypothetical protein